MAVTDKAMEMEGMGTARDMVSVLVVEYIITF
jgi:hypothetical protein